MARTEDLIAAACEFAITSSAVAGTATVFQAGVAGRQHYIAGATLAADGAIAAPVTVTILDGGTVLEQLEFPAITLAEPLNIEYPRPLRCSPGQNASMTVGSLGAGVRCDLSIRGFTRT